MKIRTNFVTNSSSYSSAEIKIENPVLLEIFNRYKQQGAFKVEDEYWSATRPFRFKKTTIEFDSEREGDEDPNILYAPTSLDEVLDSILDVMWIHSDDWRRMRDPYSFDRFFQELNERRGEILDAYITVIWNTSNDGTGECTPMEGEISEWSFSYHRSVDGPPRSDSNNQEMAENDDYKTLQDIPEAHKKRWVLHEDSTSDLIVHNRVFAFTNVSDEARVDLTERILKGGGSICQLLTPECNYLIVGQEDISDVPPIKVTKAKRLNKDGAKIRLISIETFLRQIR